MNADRTAAWNALGSITARLDARALVDLLCELRQQYGPHDPLTLTARLCLREWLAFDSMSFETYRSVTLRAWERAA